MFQPIVLVTKKILKCFCFDVLNILMFSFFGVPSAYIPIFFHQRLDFYSCSDLLNELKFSITLVCLRSSSLNSRILQWMFLNNYSRCFWFAVFNTSKFSMVLVCLWPIFPYFSAIYLDMFAWVYCSCFGVLNQLKSAIKLVSLRPIFLYFIKNVVWNKCCWDFFVFFLLIFLSLNSKSLFGSK